MQKTFLHTRLRVGDLERSIAWYCDNLGFRQMRPVQKSPAGNQIVHLELPGNAHTLELCWSADYPLDVPEDLVHIAIGVPDLIAFCDELEKKGVEIWPDGWREKFSSGGRKMAFLTDPDNYEVELLETGDEDA